MRPTFLSLALVPELALFFCLSLTWAVSGFITAIAIAACVDLAITGLAWRTARRHSVEVRKDPRS